MKVYKTPILTTGEQKVVGGKLSLRQLAYVLGGGLFAVSVSKKLYGYIGLGAFLVFAVLCICFLMLAFFKVRGHDLNLDRYLLLRLKFTLSQKKFEYRGS